MLHIKEKQNMRFLISCFSFLQHGNSYALIIIWLASNFWRIRPRQERVQAVIMPAGFMFSYVLAQRELGMLPLHVVARIGCFPYGFVRMLRFQHMLSHGVLAVRYEPLDDAVVASPVQDEQMHVIGHDDVILNHDELR